PDANGGPTLACPTLLLAGVRQIVEENSLTVAIDPGRDDSESIKTSAGLLVTVIQIQAHGPLVEPNHDAALAIGGFRQIAHGPFMTRSIRQNVRPFRSTGGA